MSKNAGQANSTAVPSAFSGRELALMLLMLLPLAAVMIALPPIPQDPAYHLLADNRTCLGIRNFGNVASNAAFLIVGVMGLRLVHAGGAMGASRSWAVFFMGTALVAAGSAYYHLNPNNQTLVWDRLPMTIAFMALFCALVSEHMHARSERTLLPIALIVGASSVAWWHFTDDLRLYAWVQFAPLLAIVFVLIACPSRYSHRRYIVLGLIWYVFAKIAEITDYAIFDFTSGAISGHSLKHLLAALAPLSIYLMLRSRRAR